MRIDHLAHAGGDANAVLAAAGYNFRSLLAWLTIFLRLWIAAIKGGEPSRNLAASPKSRSSRSTQKLYPQFE
jgi:hypothetical protein